MITDYFTFVKQGQDLSNSQGNGISRKNSAKAVAYALSAKDLYHQILNINGKDLMTMVDFIKIANEVTGNSIEYHETTDEENYQIFDAMGVPRTTSGKFKKGSEAPFSSDGMVTFAHAIREGKMDIYNDGLKS